MKKLLLGVVFGFRILLEWPEQTILRIGDFECNLSLPLELVRRCNFNK